MIASERRRSSSERTRPSVNVSENMRICASGVRSSCETPEIKSVRSRMSCDSRRSWNSAVPINAAVSASRPRISQSGTTNSTVHDSRVPRTGPKISSSPNPMAKSRPELNTAPRIGTSRGK